MSGSVHAVDFKDITALFRHVGLSLDPAECHGCLCGLLCAATELQGVDWANQVLAGKLGLPETGAPLPPPPSSAEGEGRALLLQLYGQTAEQLDDPEYGFFPLLPDDNHPLDERVEALSRWCQGFLLGLGLGGVQEQSGLPGDSHEVMRDFAEISRLGRSEGGEDDEAAYAEVLEYVRMAVLLVYEEMRPLRTARPPGAQVH